MNKDWEERKCFVQACALLDRSTILALWAGVNWWVNWIKFLVTDTALYSKTSLVDSLYGKGEGARQSCRWIRE